MLLLYLFTKQQRVIFAKFNFTEVMLYNNYLQVLLWATNSTCYIASRARATVETLAAGRWMEGGGKLPRMVTLFLQDAIKHAVVSGSNYMRSIPKPTTANITQWRTAKDGGKYLKGGNGKRFPKKHDEKKGNYNNQCKRDLKPTCSYNDAAFDNRGSKTPG